MVAEDTDKRTEVAARACIHGVLACADALDDQLEVGLVYTHWRASRSLGGAR